MIVRLLLSCLLVVSISVEETPAQEKLSLDDKTAAVVQSPWELVKVDTQASLRGLHVLNDQHIWASGTGGTVLHSADGGKSWKVQIVEDAKDLDFRDIHAIDEGTVVAMTSGTPARIYRTTNGGISWKRCYHNDDEKVFLDALAFWDDQTGVVMGDPINQSLLLLITQDMGRTWKSFSPVPKTKPGEAGFAASGTNTIVAGKSSIFVALGGALPDDSHDSSRILFSHDRGKQWLAATVPLPRTASAGIFSMCRINQEHAVVVGGDYLKPESTDHNFAISENGGKTWTVPKPTEPPSGYRSCVDSFVNGKEIKVVTVGPNGTDLSTDLGKTWRRISNEGFHAVAFTPDGKVGIATGANGRVARWVAE